MMIFRKFFQFCLIILVVAVTIGLVYPQLSRDSSNLTGLPPLEQIATDAPEQVWGSSGSTILPIAAQIMAIRNLGGVGLTVAQKGYFRPLFGGLVDRVMVVYQAKLLDRWSQNGKETHIGQIDSAAQTYCNRIYVRDADKPHDADRLVLLAHELTHAQQCQEYGGIGKFGFQYFQGYYQGGETYQNNPLEQAAQAMELKFARQVCHTVGCPPRGESYYPNYKGWGLKFPVKLMR